MLEAIKERRGDKTLERLDWLAHAYLVQQAVAYGDVTTKAVVETLYDKEARVLRTVGTDDLTKKALTAVKANPVLARNVVMVAMRRALSANTVTGLPQVTLYKRAVASFTGGKACQQDPVQKYNLDLLLPNWNLEWRPEQAEIDAAPNELSSCKAADPNLDIGSGLVVVFPELQFDVKAPSPRALETGEFERPPPLTLALAYRDKVAGERMLRHVDQYVTSEKGVARHDFAKSLLSRGCFAGKQCGQALGNDAVPMWEMRTLQ
jgi:hypothetical protein